ncbi:M20 peptidase aminoacylase family protein [Clostridioides difficile]|uniref:M20 peptidase aminoacylase family protein n=1 Tax=Clostridioides difficile TaxID=1496 RepID=UPI00093EEF4A|nr:M20 peptidase aminoacylase family protein [Clostridioides difficile]TQX30795.1 amidohydrolase [Clostridioides difficile]
MATNKDYIEYVHKVYNYLHTIPEKGFEEYKTSEFVLKELEKMGFENINKGVAGTGIIVTIDSKKEGPVFAIRADMDALEFIIDGEKKMIHACGHDGHTSMLLTAAKLIKERNLVKRGKLKILFQPGEEKLYGALRVIDSGLLDDVEEMVGMHLRPGQDCRLGKAIPAMYHCASCIMEFTIKGTTCHGSKPHLGVNAVDAVCLAVNAINAIRVNPAIPNSIKVTNISVKGETYNNIPDEAFMALDIRAESNDIIEELKEKAIHAVKTAVSSINAEAVLLSKDGVPAAEFDEELVSLAEETIKDVLGADTSIGIFKNSGGEDFHYYTQKLKCKTTYIGLGADATPGFHNPNVTFDTKALEYGVDIWCRLVEKRLG